MKQSHQGPCLSVLVFTYLLSCAAAYLAVRLWILP